MEIHYLQSAYAHNARATILNTPLWKRRRMQNEKFGVKFQQLCQQVFVSFADKESAKEKKRLPIAVSLRFHISVKFKTHAF